MILACHHHVILLVVLVLVGYFLAALTYCRGGQSMLFGPVSAGEYRITTVKHVVNREVFSMSLILEFIPTIFTSISAW
jgi:hypothetical protein